MGKIRVAVLGDEEEKEQRRKAEARRQTKKSKKEKIEGVGLHGGERTVVMEGVELKPEIKKLIEEVDAGEGTEKGKRKTEKVKAKKLPSKRYQEAAKLVDKTNLYPLSEAIPLVKKTSLTRFDGTVELHLNLRPETLGEGKAFRGSARLPHSTGKTVRVAIADDELLGTIERGVIDFDILVSSPTFMPKLAKFAKLLGPRGLMPNPKAGTVSDNPEKRAKELSQGEVNFKTEPEQPILHLVVGKVSQPEKELKENMEAYLSAIGKQNILKATLSPTMGPGIKISL